jgi:hypothetical protein
MCASISDYLLSIGKKIEPSIGSTFGSLWLERKIARGSFLLPGDPDILWVDIVAVQTLGVIV